MTAVGILFGLMVGGVPGGLLCGLLMFGSPYLASLSLPVSRGEKHFIRKFYGLQDDNDAT